MVLGRWLGRLRRAALAAAAVAGAAAAGTWAGCVPNGPGELPNARPRSPDAGTGADTGPIGGDIAILSITLELTDNVEVCSLTVTVVSPGGTQTLVPDAPVCGLAFPIFLEVALGMADLGGTEADVTVTALGRNSADSLTAQASSNAFMRLGFATDLFLSLERF